MTRSQAKCPYCDFQGEDQEVEIEYCPKCGRKL